MGRPWAGTRGMWSRWIGNDFPSLQALSISGLQSIKFLLALPFHRRGSGGPEKMNQPSRLLQVGVVRNSAPFQSLLLSNVRGWCPCVGCGGDKWGSNPSSVNLLCDPGQVLCPVCVVCVEKYKQGDQLFPGRVERYVGATSSRNQSCLIFHPMPSSMN